jgi:hypothetical protein
MSQLPAKGKAYQVIVDEGYLNYESMRIERDEALGTVFTDYDEAKDGLNRCLIFKLGGHPRLVSYRDGEMDAFASRVPRNYRDWNYVEEGGETNEDDED